MGAGMGTGFQQRARAGQSQPKTAGWGVPLCPPCVPCPGVMMERCLCPRLLPPGQGKGGEGRVYPDSFANSPGAC